MKESIFYYPVGQGYQQEEKDRFYGILKDIKEKAKSSKGHWNGSYYDTTYTMPDGTKYVYSEDMDYGIPYSLEKIQ